MDSPTFLTGFKKKLSRFMPSKACAVSREMPETEILAACVSELLLPLPPISLFARSTKPHVKKYKLQLFRSR
jgi:hypothetical protein